MEHKASADDALTPEGLAGEQLRRLRIARGWSQEELARRMGAFGVDWHQTTVGRTETAQRPLRLNEAFALAALFGVDVRGLMSPPRVEPEALSDDDLRLKIEEAVKQLDELIEARREAEQRLEQAANDHAFWAGKLSQVRMNAELQVAALSAFSRERDKREGRPWPPEPGMPA